MSQRCVGGLELLQQRQKIQALSEETNSQLKKNVYQNYMQFIETAKEISHLESEMYQLSHLLSEQRSLLSSLTESSLIGIRAPVVDLELGPRNPESVEDEQRRKLASIIEKVEGCVSLLEVPGRVLLHDGDLLELDINENTALQRIHGYLLSDSLVLTSWIPNRRGPMRYKFQVQYQLESLAVVNVRDLGSVKYAFKFLAFPDTRLFQCPSNQSKKDWLEAFDNAKKANLTQKQQQQKRESYSERPPSISNMGDSTESTNQLQGSPDRSLQGGLRAARRIVRLLNLLGCSTQACELFLKLSSSILKTQLKRTKREGVSVSYITQLGRTFFNNLMDIAKEFLKSFPNSPSCTSAFVIWVGVELQLFTSHLNKHLFIPQSSIATLAECIAAVRKQSEQLCEIGMDVRYQLDGLLRSPLMRALQDSREKLVDSVKLRAQDDAWRQSNLQSKQAQGMFIQEMKEMGFTNVQSYTFGDTWLHLTANTVAFTKLYMNLIENCMNLAIPELEHTVGETLAQVLRYQLRHVESCLSRTDIDATCLERNASFLYFELLPLAQSIYLSNLGHQSSHLLQLQKEFPKLGASSKPIAKYSTMGYI
ncbi:hypothetical protein B566_EDAN001700 [Ephemera danica]|nr:hypothetical protein B566_EDAN001700 [Ephemera danica]